jgi:hypothetical protein
MKLWINETEVETTSSLICNNTGLKFCCGTFLVPKFIDHRPEIPSYSYLVLKSRI